MVETDPGERYERICQACQGNMRMFFVIFMMLVTLNLYSCYLKRTLLCHNGFIAVLMAGALAWSMGEFYMWKGRAQRSLEKSGTLPCISWRAARRKNYGVVVLTLMFSLVPLVYTAGRASSWALIGVLAGLWIYIGILMFICSRLLSWIREKRAYSRWTNMVIYWGLGLAAGAVLGAGFLAWIFRVL